MPIAVTSCLTGLAGRQDRRGPSQWSVQPSNSPKTAIVLSGGGMRGAYEVGVVLGIAEVLGRRANDKPLFQVLSGTSVGAINAAFFAANSHYGDHGVGALREVWTRAKSERSRARTTAGPAPLAARAAAFSRPGARGWSRQLPAGHQRARGRGPAQRRLAKAPPKYRFRRDQRAADCRAARGVGSDDGIRRAVSQRRLRAVAGSTSRGALRPDRGRPRAGVGGDPVCSFRRAASATSTTPTADCASTRRSRRRFAPARNGSS